MFKRVLFLSLGVLLFMPQSIWADGDNDFGIWTEASVNKDLPKHWSVGMSTELRTEDRSRKVDRWSIGPYVGYRINKFLKLGAGYEFLYNYRSWSCENHYNSAGDWNGYNVKRSIWIPRHRALFEITGSVKCFKWLRVSLRERYQFTHEGARSDDQLRYRYAPDEDYTHYVLKEGSPELKASDASNNHMLRSRLKLSLDRKKVKWSPYISCELHNNLGDGFHLDKLRTCLGTDYKINKHHSVGFGGLWNHSCSSKDNLFALTVGYDFDF